MLVRLLLAAATALAGPVSLAAVATSARKLDGADSSASAAAAPPPLASYSGFGSTCEAITLYTVQAENHVPDQLRAHCRDNAGALHATSIDLNLCLGIDYQDATLLWSIYGKFSEYCSSCWWTGTGVVMECACTALAGSTAAPSTNSTIDLDAGIGNVYGTLRCAGGSTGKSGRYGRRDRV